MKIKLSELKSLIKNQIKLHEMHGSYVQSIGGLIDWIKNIASNEQIKEIDILFAENKLETLAFLLRDLDESGELSHIKDMQLIKALKVAAMYKKDPYQVKIPDSF